MKLISVVMLAVLASACSPQEKTYTVTELLKDPVLMEKISNWCDESPGERTAISNCINIKEANYQAHLKHENDHRNDGYDVPEKITNWGKK